MIYLDNAATTKPKQAVIDAVNECLINTWGNPSSLHTMGKDAKSVVDKNRKIVADFIGAKPSEIIFTSGACEANSLALCGYLNAHKRDLLITSSIEHKSIINIAEAYQDASIIIPVNVDGFVDLLQLEKALKQLSSFARPIVSIQYANNEIGTIQDMESISEIVHRYRGVFHTDATQIMPNWQIDVKGIDMMSFSGQKLGAPKGIGVLYVKEGIDINTIIYGSQEKSRRGGTENVPYIAGLGAAIKELEYGYSDVKDYFVKRVIEAIDGTYLVGSEYRLKNNASICFKGISGELLLLMLNERGIYASAGSACNHEPSHVLKAIGLSDEDIGSTVRFTFGDQTKEDVNFVVDSLVEIVGILRKFNKSK